MKKISLFLVTIIALLSCKNEHPANYTTLSGKLENNTDSIITISSRGKVLKTIKINKDGTFKDTLKINNAAVYTFQTSKEKIAPIYLNNGFNLVLNGDLTDFKTQVSFKGEGSENSKYLLSQIALSEEIGNPALILALEEEEFNKKIGYLENSFDSILTSYKNLDSSLEQTAKTQNEKVIAYFKKSYEANLSVKKGKASPKFENYVDVKGGTKSLDSFKGKYLYIDVWATWCGPCIQQIPYLQELEKQYHAKNIEFVSISTDESRRSGGSWEAAEKKWRDFVKAKQMTGVQLWSGQDISFQRDYQINGIPRFILIDPNGNIVDANAPRPSDPRLKELFTSLGI
ncbi:TlpA family protein disulfide reductase [Polaribacter sp.]|uniref:TlpA family protein disulfide reductase n=1 Tax=Polaribacter sp. TaxID=1920175 RepID=UPI003EF3FE92